MPRKMWVVLGLVCLMLVGAAPPWPASNGLYIDQRFGRDKYEWSYDGNSPYPVYYPTSILVSAKAVIPAGKSSITTGAWFPVPFQGSPVILTSVYFTKRDTMRDYQALPTIAVTASMAQCVTFLITRPVPSDMGQPFEVVYFWLAIGAR